MVCKKNTETFNSDVRDPSASLFLLSLRFGGKLSKTPRSGELKPSNFLSPFRFSFAYGGIEILLEPIA
jgi:hypothetical protein